MLQHKQRPSPHILYSTLLGATGAHALPVPDLSEASSMAQLDAVGKDILVSQLATGRLPAEVALLYGVPVLHFRAWMRDRLTEDEVIEIRSAAAESLQVKAMLTLSANLMNPAQASQAKALSDRMAKVAEALSPKEWSPSRVEAPGSMPSISISLDFGDAAPPVAHMQVRATPVQGGIAPAEEYDTRDQLLHGVAPSELSGGEDGVLQDLNPPPGASYHPDNDPHHFPTPRARPPIGRAARPVPEHTLRLLEGVDPWSGPAPRKASMSEGLPGEVG